MKYNKLRNVVTRQCAISDTIGTADFYELPSVKECTWRPEASALELATPAMDAVKYTVPVQTLDSCFMEKDGLGLRFWQAVPARIDVIKIDIEGFEAHALRGGMRTITKHRPVLAIDIHAKVGGTGDTEAEVRGLLSPLGYTFERVWHVLFCKPASDVGRRAVPA